MSVFSIPDMSPDKPLKCNILHILSSGYVLDVDTFYQILSRKRRDMPSGKYRYKPIWRALNRLIDEGWPIEKSNIQVGGYDIPYYGAGKDFMNFYLQGISKVVMNEFNSIRDEIRRINILDAGYRDSHIDDDITPLDPSVIKVNHGVIFEIPKNSYKEKDPKMIYSATNETTFDIPLSAVDKLLPLLTRTLYLDVKMKKETKATQQ